jgi:hypothetical protein
VADRVEGVNGVVQQDKLFISCASAYTVIHDDPEYYNISARWLPKQLTDECGQACMTMSMRVISDILKTGRFRYSGLLYAMKQGGIFLNLQVNI